MAAWQHAQGREIHGVRLRTSPSLAWTTTPALAPDLEARWRHAAAVLADPDVRQSRGAALSVLGCAGRLAAGAVPVVALSLSSAVDRHVRALSARTLSEIASDDIRVAAPLVRALRSDESPWVRAEAARALGTLEPAGPGDDACSHGSADESSDPCGTGRCCTARHITSSLHQALEDEPTQVREAAAEALAARGTDAAVPWLQALADQDPSPRVRLQALAALWELTRSPDVAGRLLAVGRAGWISMDEVARAAALALGPRPGDDEWPAGTVREMQPLGERALRLIARLDQPPGEALDHLLAQVEHPQIGAGYRETLPALERLGMQIPDELALVLVPPAFDDRPEIRAAAVDLLVRGRLHSTLLDPVIAGALEHGDPAQRPYAMELLLRLGSEAVRRQSKVLGKLLESADPAMREGAEQALASLEDEPCGRPGRGPQEP
jgi:HEAT repeat protein